MMIYLTLNFVRDEYDFRNAVYENNASTVKYDNHTIRFHLLLPSIDSTKRSCAHQGCPPETGLRFISFLNPPCFCCGALDSGENEGGIWLISLLDPDPP